MPKDANKSMRIAYDTVLYGNVLRSNGDTVPAYAFSVPLGENPDLYILYSHPGNVQIPNFTGVRLSSAMQITVVEKTLSNAPQELENVVAQIKQLIQPRTEGQTLNPDGFQVVTTDEYNDIMDSYPDSTNTAQNTGASKMVFERNIFYRHILWDKTRV